MTKDLPLSTRALMTACLCLPSSKDWFANHLQGRDKKRSNREPAVKTRRYETNLVGRASCTLVLGLLMLQRI